MMGCSGGCEPEFALSYTRHTINLNESYKVYCQSVNEYCEVTHSSQENLPEYFVSSENINWKDRIEVQGIMQKWVDTAISSTINLAEETQREEIEQIYLYAWEKGLKGITVFRSGCKRVAILDTKDTDKDQDKENLKKSVYNFNNVNDLPRGAIINCCNDLIGKKRKLQTGCGSLHVLGYFDTTDGSLQEIYLAKGSTGGCQNFMIGLSRAISLLCRAGVDIYTIKDQLDSTGVCASYAVRSATHHDASRGSCCPMAVGNALVDMYEEMQKELDLNDNDEELITAEAVKTTNAKSPQELKITKQNLCPECGAPLIHDGGCDHCRECGYSHCS